MDISGVVDSSVPAKIRPTLNEDIHQLVELTGLSSEINPLTGMATVTVTVRNPQSVPTSEEVSIEVQVGGRNLSITLPASQQILAGSSVNLKVQLGRINPLELMASEVEVALVLRHGEDSFGTASSILKVAADSQKQVLADYYNSIIGSGISGFIPSAGEVATGEEIVEQIQATEELITNISKDEIAKFNEDYKNNRQTNIWKKKIGTAVLNKVHSVAFASPQDALAVSRYKTFAGALVKLSHKKGIKGRGARGDFKSMCKELEKKLKPSK
jgi:hypothetical protein